MDFVAVILFTQQVFHLEWLFFFILLILKIIIVLDQVSVWCCLQSDAYIKRHNVVFYSPKDEEVTLLYEFIFVVFHRGDIVKKNIVKNVGFRKKTKGGNGHIGDVAHRRGRRGGCKPSAHYKNLFSNILGGLNIKKLVKELTRSGLQ